VVVVGISAAGIRAAKTIAEFAKGGYPNLHITMIDKNEYHYHAIGAPRALVDKEFGTTLLFPLKNLLTSFEANRASPKHTFLQASLTAVNANNTITVSTGETIRFNYLVLATGTTSSLPAKLQGSTTEDAAACLHKVHDAVKEAKSILIIGGGAVGVESAGEIATNYPDKKVTLVHAADRLLPANFQKGLSNGAVDKLGKVGVKVVLNEKVVLPEGVQFDHQVRPLTLQSKSGSTYESDLQILATGGRPSAQYIESLETEAGAELRDGNGAIKVRATLQLDSDKFPNIFVPGDV
ncbi:FAD/NAD(P)-binding domain-containing protein, partial [Martensiomyces pterosporus]